MKAIIFSDLHLHIWAKHNANNRRLRAQKDAVTFIVKQAFKYKVPVFFGGDWNHSPENLTNALLSETLPFLTKLLNTYPVKIYGINGNHDYEEQNSYDRRSPGYITTFANTFENFVSLDFDSVEFDDFVVHGIPYIHGNRDYPEVLGKVERVKGKKNILLNHCDYSGQKDVGDIVVGKGENIDEGQLKLFDLVWSGHIHRAGKVRNNIYSIGSTVQTRISDMDYDFGYWILRDNFDMEFKPLDWTPKFRYFEKESEKDNDTDLWVKKPVEVEDIVTKRDGVQIDLSDKQGVIDGYLDALGVKSKTKRRFIKAQL